MQANHVIGNSIVGGPSSGVAAAIAQLTPFDTDANGPHWDSNKFEIGSITPPSDNPDWSLFAADYKPARDLLQIGNLDVSNAFVICSCAFACLQNWPIACENQCQTCDWSNFSFAKIAPDGPPHARLRRVIEGSDLAARSKQLSVPPFSLSAFRQRTSCLLPDIQPQMHVQHVAPRFPIRADVRCVPSTDGDSVRALCPNQMPKQVTNVLQAAHPDATLFKGDFIAINAIINLGAPLAEGQLGFSTKSFINIITFEGATTGTESPVQLVTSSNPRGFNGGKALVGNFFTLKVGPQCICLRNCTCA